METSCVCLYFTKSDLAPGPKFIQWRPSVSAFTKARFSPWTKRKKWDWDIKLEREEALGPELLGWRRREERKEGGRSTCLRPRIKSQPEVVLNPILLPSTLKIYDGLYMQLPQSLIPAFLYFPNFLLMVITRNAMPATTAPEPPQWQHWG